MDQIILWSAIQRADRERNASAWRRYNALQVLLDGQSQRVGELDAMLGVATAVESGLFVWFLDKTYTSNHVYSSVITWLMTVPILTAAIASFAVHAGRSPDAISFEEGLSRDERATLIQAIAGMLDTFNRNLWVATMKESCLLLSLITFLLAAIAYTFGNVLQWR